MAHNHAPANFNRAFAIAVVLNLVYTIVEAIYAFFTNSVSLLADAGHNLGDVLGLAFAWFASYLNTKPPSERYSFGYKRTTIYAAFSNAMLLVITALLIGWESINRFIKPVEQIDEPVVIIVATIGILINAGTAVLFLKGRKRDLNVQGAFLHLAYDALISLGVVITAIVIMFTQWLVLDPIIGLAIVAIIIFGTWELLRDSSNMLLDATPRHIDSKELKKYLYDIEGVIAVHHVHIWGLSTQQNALTAHLVMPDKKLSDDDFTRINQELEDKFHIHHATLQVENSMSDHNCSSDEE